MCGVCSRMARTLIGLCLCLVCGCQATLYSGLEERDANEMLSLLRANGVEAGKESAGKGLWNLVVDDAAVARSLELLAGAGLPRARYQSMGDVFRKDGMVSTPTEEQVRLVYALGQELAGTIANIDGVLAARVHIVLPETDGFGKKTSSSSASVFIKHRAEADLTPHISAIKHMVGNSVRDLQYEAVSVFLFPSAAPPFEAPRTVRLLGLAVAPESASRLRLWLAGALGGLGLLGAAGGVVAWRRRRQGRAPGGRH